ncbi:MAG: CpsD/CapB family tyrosine-protein kinase [Steroidobacteraceae bacterium]
MTIQQAIERAKELRKSREEATGRAVVREPVAASARTERRVPPSAARVAAAQAADEAAHPAAALAFPLLSPDAATCDRNRALVAAEITPMTSIAHDAYRIMRTQLRTKAAKNGWQSFAVTSAGPGEGKSTTALNLALSLAREKRQNVFLIDLDLRSPSLASYLGVTPVTEIGSVLSGDADPQNAFFSIGVEQLAVAAGTRHFDNSSELLAGPALDELFAHIRSLDPGALTIVDLPPILATADALVIAPKVSATVLVVSEGKTRRDELQRAGEMLASLEIAGVVLNRSTQVSSSYYGYY